MHQFLNVKGRLIDLSVPKIMGILNVTPDSFYDGGSYDSGKKALVQAGKMLEEGADILDIGGMSSRPGAEVISVEEERQRVIPIIKAISKEFPEAVISIDTVRSQIAKEAVESGAAIVNDISAGSLDKGMYETVGALKVPYVLMHMKGRPETMQDRPDYDDPVLEITDFFIRETEKLRQFGVHDIVLDPGFGFGKRVEDNYQILKRFKDFSILDYPLLAGVSRKSMIYKPLGITPQEALNGTTALHMVALQNGASILRVHDVKEAVECLRIYNLLNEN